MSLVLVLLLFFGLVVQQTNSRPYGCTYICHYSVSESKQSSVFVSMHVTQKQNIKTCVYTRHTRVALAICAQVKCEMNEKRRNQRNSTSMQGRTNSG